jgi:serine/threonine-protein kinase RsbW
MTHTQLPLRVEARDDEARLALENELRAKGLSLVVIPADGNGNTSAVLEMPSDLAFLEPVTNYLTKFINMKWSVTADSSLPVAVALHEALVNAIKHGNNNDPTKQVRISADVSNEEAKFIVEDEGEGFDEPPNPLSADNLYKASGRGVLLIRSIMDEANYNQRGNVVTMIKKRSSLDLPVT